MYAEYRLESQSGITKRIHEYIIKKHLHERGSGGVHWTQPAKESATLELLSIWQWRADFQEKQMILDQLCNC